ncbi:dihydropteroate synthase [Roseomonas elaeocarpi]|uniref:Dihydropteroate synthase n=1 Tax=Roseomonas elaeocarpi TaxID=907779 RepID=A0ABV6JQT2_9PROT
MNEWIEPLALVHGGAARDAIAAGSGLPLRGVAHAFTLVRDPANVVLSVRDLPVTLLDAAASLGEVLPPVAGLPADRAAVMGILNVTPDSFSDGGLHATPEAAIAAGRAMLAAGADLLDIGAESTRPGAAPVTVEEECRRLIPVVEALAGEGIVSVDTRHALTMRRALEAGARMINDVAALREPGALEAVAGSECAVVLMHMPGLDPATMQERARYDDVVAEVVRFLAERIAACEAAGIARHRILADPGIGFGKTMEHDLELLRRLPVLHALGCRVLLGASRKKFIGRITGEAVAARRLGGSLAVALAGDAAGASVIRVHDVPDTVQALRMVEAMR